MSAPEIVLFHGLLAELCTDVCLDMHRAIWMGEFEQGESVSSFLHDSQRVQQVTRSHERTAPPFNPLGATPAPQLQCLNCGKAVNAKKLAPHLEKVSNGVHLCLGLLFNPPNWCHLPISFPIDIVHWKTCAEAAQVVDHIYSFGLGANTHLLVHEWTHAFVCMPFRLENRFIYTFTFTRVADMFC